MAIQLKNMFFDKMPRQLELAVDEVKDVTELKLYIADKYGISTDQFIFLVNGHKPKAGYNFQDDDVVNIMVPIFGG